MKDTTLTQQKRMTLPTDQDGSGRSFGVEEVEALRQALENGCLFSVKGKFVKQFEKDFAALMGAKHAHACSSGTAAVHIAIGAIDPEPGDEIVTSPITDMGALTPIVYQGAIPVFADVDPRTCNVMAKTIAARLSPKTRAIVITHLFGNPCEMDEIMALADARGIPVIEDCAQAFGTRYKGRPIGTFGKLGAFSLQQGKHITTGEGGIVISDDDELARRAFLHVNKAWGYGDAKPDHYFLALNYRMSELTGAVAAAQLPKLANSVARRVANARRLTNHLKDLPGIRTPWIPEGGEHTYWKYCLWVDDQVLPGGTVALGKVLGELGIASAPRYIQKPAFMCEVFQKQRTFGTSRWPFTLARPEAVDYRRENFPGAWAALESILVLPWNERYTEEHVDYIADCIRQAVNRLQEEKQ